MLLFQVLLPLLKSDLYEVILNTMNGKLASNAPVWHQDSSAVTVVMASAGYPGSYKKGVEITGTTWCNKNSCLDRCAEGGKKMFVVSESSWADPRGKNKFPCSNLVTHPQLIS